MYCYKCGENNPDEAKFCKNCGAKLKKEETVKKVEVIEAPTYQKEQTNTTTGNSSNSGSFSWIGCCCLGLIIVFILSAIFSGF